MITTRLAKKLNDTLQYSSSSLVDILLLIRSVTTLATSEKKTRVLTERSAMGWNALMMAIYYHPHAVGPLLRLIETLEIEDQLKILKQVSVDGWNALMMAVRYRPNAVKPLLQLIENYEKRNQKEILTQFNKGYENVLTLAVRNCPEVIGPLLESIETLTEQEQIILWMLQTEAGRYNPLTLAVCHQSEAVGPFLQSIAKFGVQNRVKILACPDENGNHALMLAIRYHPEVIKPILQSIAKLGVQDRGNILKRVNSEPLRSNALMLAVRYHPEAIKPLLKSIAILEKDDIFQIFNQLKTDDWACILKQSASLTKELLYSLDSSQLKSLFSQKKLRSDSRLKEYFKFFNQFLFQRYTFKDVLNALAEDRKVYRLLPDPLQELKIIRSIAYETYNTRKISCDSLLIDKGNLYLQGITELASYINYRRSQGTSFYHGGMFRLHNRKACSAETKIAAAEKVLGRWLGKHPAPFTEEEQIALGDGQLKRICMKYKDLNVTPPLPVPENLMAMKAIPGSTHPEMDFANVASTNDHALEKVKQLSEHPYLSLWKQHEPSASSLSDIMWAASAPPYEGHEQPEKTEQIQSSYEEHPLDTEVICAGEVLKPTKTESLLQAMVAPSQPECSQIEWNQNSLENAGSANSEKPTGYSLSLFPEIPDNDPQIASKKLGNPGTNRSRAYG
ncbi:hypothetical protein Lspi_1987 [Legionella spiritensis]|uniref:Ankyrin repeats (3 copies) n=1 Tax=Legionella spiritensis TaxID=452 RepID=A0A0W0YZ22_LEGSP|nr:hypothetical protein Lspi_1987 [Legionella spiritensis]SNV34004.1 Uncharacterised protein [Legionella spiritensis]